VEEAERSRQAREKEKLLRANVVQLHPRGGWTQKGGETTRIFEFSVGLSLETKGVIQYGKKKGPTSALRRGKGVNLLKWVSGGDFGLGKLMWGRSLAGA